MPSQPCCRSVRALDARSRIRCGHWRQARLGPFGKLGGTAKVILGVIAAVVLCIGIGAFLSGVGKPRGWFGEGHSPMEGSRGKGMMVGGLTCIILVASLSTIVVTTYSMGV